MQYGLNIDDRAERAALAEKFLGRRPDVKAWFERHKNDTGWDFPRSVYQSLFDWGSLTPNQLAAVERGIARDARRDERWQQSKPTAARVDLSNVPDGMYAVPGGDTRLKVQVKRGKKGGRWERVIFVSDGATYGQRKSYGRQYPGRAYEGDIQDELAKIAADPKAAMAAYGHLVGRCGRCGRPLEDEESVARGIGPVCIGKMGW